MLRDARAARRSGVDAVVAYWERQGRSATAAQIGHLDIVPTRTVTYRGASFAELDVQAVLARRPQPALVDELAHANLPGERHPKRWQDVDDLLAHHIDVYTTLNVANIESLGRIVAQITGTRRAEPVPDAFVRAGEIKLINLEPQALRRRLTQGLVFPARRVDAALSHYFRFANLAALQELAQLWLDDTVPDPAKAYLAAHRTVPPSPAPVVVVGLGGADADQWLIRYAADLARLTGAQLRGVHVHVADGTPRRARSQLDARSTTARRPARLAHRGHRHRYRLRTDPSRPQTRCLPAGHRLAPRVAVGPPAARIHRRTGPQSRRRPSRPGRQHRTSQHPLTPTTAISAHTKLMSPRPAFSPNPG